MNKFFQTIWEKKIALLLGLPLFYLLIAAYFRSLLGATSLRSVDPEYIYFISGLGISEGHLKIGHIDNPGTPLQYLIAFVFRITYLFRPGNNSYLEDMFLHPDLYLSVTNLFITALIVVTMFVAGRYVYKKSGSILYALLVQTVPFLPIIWYDLIGRITPELLFPLPLFAISMLMVKYLFEDNYEIKFVDVVLMGFVFAFGLSIKLTFISLWFIPLIIIQKWKMKLLFLGSSILFFLLIALPVTLQLDPFWNWIKALFLHSGAYGGGKENIVNLTAFKTNLINLINLEKYFVWLFLGLVMLLVVFVLFFRKKNKTWKGIIISTAIIVAILIQFVLTGKHYAHRYFIPALMMAPLLVILSIELIKKMYPRNFLALGLNIGLLIFLGWNVNRQFEYIRIKSQAIENQIAARQKTWHVASTLQERSIKIIVSQDYGSPFKEYALLYSTAWAANQLKPHYYKELLKLYPNTYQFTTWDDRFQHWGDQFQPSDIFNKDLPVYVYLEKNSDELYDRTIHKLDPNNKYEISRKTVFINPDNNEAIYQLVVNEEIAERP